MKVVPEKRDRVLIVDDEAGVREVLRDILEQEGYQVIAVESALAALKQARQKSFDLILADIMMPEMNGLELVQRVRELNPEAVPILITGHPSLETVEAAIPRGIHDYIVKPIDKAELCTVIASAFAAKKLADEQAEPRIASPGVSELPREATRCRKERAGNHSTVTSVIQTLRNSELFDTLSDQELHKVAIMCQEQAYEAGESIYSQGERAHKLYVVRDGCVALQRAASEGDRKEATVEVVEQGAALGWVALIGHRVHTVSAVCLRPTKILAIDGAELRCMLDKEPGAGYEVMKRLAVLLDNRLAASYRVPHSKV